VYPEDLVPLGAAPPVYAAVSNYSVVPFVAWLSTPEPTLARDPAEVAAVLEVPLDTLVDETAWVDATEPLPGRHLPVVDITIWGLTARLLAELLPAFRQAHVSPTAPNVGATGAAIAPGSHPGCQAQAHNRA